MDGGREAGSYLEVALAREDEDSDREGGERCSEEDEVVVDEADEVRDRS